MGRKKHDKKQMRQEWFGLLIWAIKAVFVLFLLWVAVKLGLAKELIELLPALR